MNPEYEKYPKIFQALNKAGTKFPDLLLDKNMRILQHCESLWGSKEAGIYFDSLMLEDRNDRNGFPPELLNDIWLLKQIHESLFPGFSISIHDPFNNIEVGEASGIHKIHSSIDKSKDLDVHNVIASPQQKLVLSPANDKVPLWPNIRSLHELYEADDVRRNGGHVYANQGKRIGEILKSLGLIDDKILDAVEKRHNTKKAKDKPTGELLVYMGIIEKEALTRALCIQAGVLMVDVLLMHIPYEILNLVPDEKIIEKQAIPVGAHKGTMFLAVADPLNFSDQQYFSFTTGLNIRPVFAPRHEIIERSRAKRTDTSSDIWAG